jgi:hypothetical protein
MPLCGFRHGLFKSDAREALPPAERICLTIGGDRKAGGRQFVG